MSHKLVSRVLALLLSCLSMSLFAASSSVVDTGVSRQPDIDLPSKPIHTQAQLDTYLRDTPVSHSPLNWLTPAAQKRFLDGLVFHEAGLSGLYLGDVSYELTREQAFALLSVFGVQNYALGLDARSTPRHIGRSSGVSAMEAGYNQLAATADRLDRPPESIAQVYAERFSLAQTDARRRALSDRDAEFLFRAATLAFQVNHRPTDLEDMRADFSELQRRRLVDRPHASDLYDAFVVTGKTNEARSLQKRYPLIERGTAPTMKTASRIGRGNPSVWIINTERGKREFVRYPFNIRARSQVIVLASTACHFSGQAARDIEADPRLREIFRASGQWVAPASELTAFDAIRSWNERYPSARLGVIHDDAELSMVARIVTPTFYFLDHGRVVDTVVGWPPGGNLDAIRHGLRTINLLR